MADLDNKNNRDPEKEAREDLKMILQMQKMRQKQHKERVEKLTGLVTFEACMFIFIFLVALVVAANKFA